MTAILGALGSGLGFALASPWSAGGLPAAFTIGAGIWLIVVQWGASGVGGYLTGRLRTRWHATHPHEVFFRDTAHGLLAWCVATLAVTLVVAVAADQAARPGSPNTKGSASTEGINSYPVRTLFRTLQPVDPAVAEAARADASEVLRADLLKSGMPGTDRDYLAGLVSARTGITAADAGGRVDAAFAQVQDAAEQARRASSALLIFTALSMLLGALIACVAAALGGQQRDEHP
jgi:hypothetical protein